MLSCAVLILATGAVVVGIILTLTYAYNRLWRAPEQAARDLSKSLVVGFKELFNITPRVTVNEMVVVQESYPVFELATVTREVTTSYEYSNQWLGSEKTLIVRGRFRIKGGFDLAQSCQLAVQPGTLKITAKFPKPKVLSVEMISTEIESSDNGLWNRLKPEDHKDAMDGLLQTARRQAALGMAAEAKKNLEEKLRELARRKGSAIEFEYGFSKK